MMLSLMFRIVRIFEDMLIAGAVIAAVFMVISLFYAIKNQDFD